MANETTTAQPSSWLDTLGGWVTSAGKIFNAGSEVYVAAQQRLNAIESVNEDTVKASTPAAPKIVSGMPSSMPSWVMPAAIAAGVLVLIIIVRKLR